MRNLKSQISKSKSIPISNKPSKKESKIKESGKTSSSGEPRTMKELLAVEEGRIRPLKRGDQVKAKILKIGRREIVCDIRGKSYALVVGRQFELIREFLPYFKVGDEITARVIIPEMEGGETLISFKEIAVSKLWNNLIEAGEKGKEIEITALKTVSGGLLVDCSGLRGFIPQTQLDQEFSQNPQKLMGRRFLVKILEIDQKQNRLVLSQKEVTQKEELSLMRKAISTCTLGEVLEGEVFSVDKYGLTIKVVRDKIKLEGLVHISEVSWARVEDLGKLYRKGDKVKVEVIGLNKQEARLDLSIKKLQPDPWEKAEEKYPKEKEVLGKVVKVSGLGVFVELENGVEGLLHISKIPVGQEFKVGERISVVIEKLDVANRKISLSYVPTKKPIGYR